MTWSLYATLGMASQWDSVHLTKAGSAGNHYHTHFDITSFRFSSPP
jgi:hypothetical protein